MLVCPSCGTQGRERDYPTPPARYCWDCLVEGHGWVQVKTLTRESTTTKENASGRRHRDRQSA